MPPDDATTARRTLTANGIVSLHLGLLLRIGALVLTVLVLWTMIARDGFRGAPVVLGLLLLVDVAAAVAVPIARVRHGVVRVITPTALVMARPLRPDRSLPLDDVELLAVSENLAPRRSPIDFQPWRVWIAHPDAARRPRRWSEPWRRLEPSADERIIAALPRDTGLVHLDLHRYEELIVLDRMIDHVRAHGGVIHRSVDRLPRRRAAATGLDESLDGSDDPVENGPERSGAAERPTDAGGFRVGEPRRADFFGSLAFCLAMLGVVAAIIVSAGGITVEVAVGSAVPLVLAGVGAVVALESLLHRVPIEVRGTELVLWAPLRSDHTVDLRDVDEMVTTPAVRTMPSRFAPQRTVWAVLLVHPGGRPIAVRHLLGRGLSQTDVSRWKQNDARFIEIGMRRDDGVTRTRAIARIVRDHGGRIHPVVDETLAEAAR